MSQVVTAVLETVRTGIQEGLTYRTCWDVLSRPKACWDHRTVRGNPGHVCSLLTNRLSARGLDFPISGVTDGRSKQTEYLPPRRR